METKWKQNGNKMETKWIMIAISVAFLAMFSAIGVDKYSQNIKEVEFAKAGLQECREAGYSVWKKECK